jgi:release factor glutamine methyltransferase
MCDALQQQLLRLCPETSFPSSSDKRPWNILSWFNRGRAADGLFLLSGNAINFKTMTIRAAKILGIKQLKRAARAEAAIDAEILLAHALKISREELLAHDERPVPSFALAKFKTLLARRAKHEPVAYLTGHKEFFGLQFAVNKYTLIPRPETELLVEEALKIIRLRQVFDTAQHDKNKVALSVSKGSIIIDVGTGSGAIAVAIAKNAPGTTVIATDILQPALKIAARNALINDVDDQIILKRLNLLGHKNTRSPIFATAGAKTIITANLPYLPTKVWQKCPPDVKKFEPKTALEGGRDGLKYYDELFHQVVAQHLKAIIICEIDPSQKKSFPKLAARHFPDAAVEIKNDLAGRPRMAVISYR